jgi:hypothetical protein
MRLGKLKLRQRFLVLGVAVAAPAAVLAGLLVPSGSAANANVVHASTSSTYYTTFYGWVDNSPPGPAIAYTGCTTPGGQKVKSDVYTGNNGTYNDPLVMAWPNDLNGPWCQIGYVPFLKKYFIHADQCNPCGGVNTDHWDLWMGGDKNSTSNPEKKALLACEDKWTGHNTIILNPSSSEPVDTTPLFTPPTTCHGGTGDTRGGGS